MLSKPSQSDREEVSKMSKNKKNTLGANELESVAGGNKYLEELGKSDNFDLEWILSKQLFSNFLLTFLSKCDIMNLWGFLLILVYVVKIPKI